jgi:hypothetical protein
MSAGLGTQKPNKPLLWRNGLDDVYTANIRLISDGMFIAPVSIQYIILVCYVESFAQRMKTEKPKIRP